MENKLLKEQLVPNEEQILNICITIPNNISEDHQVLVFRLRDKDNELVGQPLTAFVKIIREPGF